MKKIILVFQFIIMLFSITNAQIGGAGGGSTGGSSGSGGSGSSGGGISPNININVNRNSPTQPGTSLYGTNTAFNRNGPSGPEKDRCVVWIHGMNGNGDSWSNAAYCSMTQKVPNFPARKLWSKFDFSYSQGSNMDNAGGSVYTNVIIDLLTDQPKIGVDPSRNFLIGHSQGGIVARTMLKDDICKRNTPPNEMGYGGIVTVCSPNQGAKLLSNKPYMTAMAEDMCNELGAGPVVDFERTQIKVKILGFKFSLGTVGGLINLSDYVDDVCKVFNDSLASRLLGNAIPKTAKDYEVGSSHLAILNNGCGDAPNLDSFPKVAFYGVEPDTGLMFRNAQYFLTPPNEFEPFDANEDTTLISSFNKNYKWYQDKVIENQVSYDHWNDIEWNCQNIPFYSLFNWAPCNSAAKQKLYALKAIAAYKRGVAFLNSMDDKYKRIIGALSYEKQATWYCDCNIICPELDCDYGNNPPTSVEITGPNAACKPINSQWECNKRLKLKILEIKKASDGTVLAESAMNLPKATMPPVLLANTSHMQARNNEAIRKALIELYDSKGFFHTDKR